MDLYVILNMDWNVIWSKCDSGFESECDSEYKSKTTLNESIIPNMNEGLIFKYGTSLEIYRPNASVILFILKIY